MMQRRMTDGWTFSLIPPVGIRNEDAAVMAEFARRDTESAERYPYTARVLSFKAKDPDQSEHSPKNRRKTRPVILAATPHFHYHVFHFVGRTYEELQRVLGVFLARQFILRNASHADILVCKFITKFECVGLRCKVRAKK